MIAGLEEGFYMNETLLKPHALYYMNINTTAAVKFASGTEVNVKVNLFKD